MRITIVTGFFLPVPPLRGGATEKVWHRLAVLFAARGHAVTFISRRYPGLPDHGESDGIRHIRVEGFEHSRSRLLNLLLDLVWGWRVARVLPKADILVCNTLTLPAWIHGFSPAAGAVSVMIGRIPKGQDLFYGSVARVYAPSSAVSRRLRRASVAARARVVGYPIDWGALALERAGPRDPVVFGYVGRIHPEKGITLLLKAAGELAARKDLPAWRLIIAGPSDVASGGGGPPWLNTQRELAAALGDRVEWRGPEFDAGRLAALYASLDVFCYPSVAQDGETFGVAAAEAMAAGCATVVSKLSCFSELVTDGETGLVFDHTDAKPASALAACMQRLLADPPLRRALSEKGREHVRRLDYAAYCERMLGDFTQMTTGANPGGR